jgi:L-asparaginase/Glu-tRNA(Gln) amidotransferase subunit D
VDVLMVYQGAPGDLIKAAVDNGARGIVMATAGAGATSGTQGEGLAYAAEKGVFVVTTTRTGSGRISGSGPSPEQRARMSEAAKRRLAFTVGGEDHQPVKARVLLMLALATTTDRDEIQRIFREY